MSQSTYLNRLCYEIQIKVLEMLRAEIQTTHQLSTALELHQQKLFSLDLRAMKHLVQNLHRSISKAEFEQVCPWWLDSRRTSTACHHLECKRRSRLELTIHPGKKLNIFSFCWKCWLLSKFYLFVMIFCWQSNAESFCEARLLKVSWSIGEMYRLRK